MGKSRKQCSVRDENTGTWRPVKATDVGKEVFDKKSHELIGKLIEPNPNTKMLRMKRIDGKIITLMP